MEKSDRIKIFKDYMSKVERHTDDLEMWLENKTDFFQAPASGSFHNNYAGGLFDHSLNVVKFGLSLNTIRVKTFGKAPLSNESLVVCGFLHDLCKTNCYKWGTDKFTKINNKWCTYQGWEYEDKLPLGHGEKSLYLASQHIELSPDEAAAIRWHMGAFEPGVNFDYPTGFSYKKAGETFSLVKMLQAADVCAGTVEDAIDYKANAKPQTRKR
jgi:hypothetical protein